MKVALVTEELAQGCGSGGIGGAFHELALLLARGGHSVDIIYCPPGSSQARPDVVREYYGAHDIAVLDLPVADYAWDTGSPETRAYATFCYLRACKEPYDAIHFHDYKGLGHFCAAAKRQGLAFPSTTLVVQVHGPTRWALEANGHDFSHEDQLKIDFLEQGSIAGADVVVSPSRYMLNWLQGKAWRTPPRDRVHVIQNCCTRLLATSPAAAAPSKGGRRPNEVVLFARHEERKGLTAFCDALDLVADELVEAGIQVTFLGPLGTINGEASLIHLAGRAKRWRFPMAVLPDMGRKEAAAYLVANPRALVVVPSPIENSPYTVLEAVALGKPLLTSCDGGAPELLDAATARKMTCRMTGTELAAALRTTLSKPLSTPRPAVSYAATERAWLQLHDSFASMAKPVIGCDDAPQHHRSLPSVTVAITHFERPAKLFDAVLSLSRQTYRALDIVVVDDGSSSPETLEALDRMQPLFDRLGVRVLRQPNSYLGAARNHAARESKSDYLLFLDDDDLAFPTLVATLVQAAEATTADVMGCVNLFMEEHRRIHAHPFPDAFAQKASYVPLGGPLALAPLANVYGSATSLIRRSLFDRVGGYTEQRGVGHEDYEFYVRALQEGARIEVCPLPLYLYEVGRPSMISRTSQQKNFHRVAQAIDMTKNPRAWEDLASLNAGRRAREHADNLAIYIRQTSPHAELLNALAALPANGAEYARKAAELAAASHAADFARALLALAHRRSAPVPSSQPMVEVGFAAETVLGMPPPHKLRDPHILGALVDLELGRVMEAATGFRLSAQRERRISAEQRHFLVALAAAPACPPAALEPIVDALQRLTLPSSIDGDLGPTLFRILLRAGAAGPTLNIVDRALRHDHMAYVESYPDIRAAAGDCSTFSLQHYVEFGVAEGRTGFQESSPLAAVLQEELGVCAPLARLRNAVAALGGAIPVHGGAVMAVAT